MAALRLPQELDEGETFSQFDVAPTPASAAPASASASASAQPLGASADMDMPAADDGNAAAGHDAYPEDEFFGAPESGHAGGADFDLDDENSNEDILHMKRALMNEKCATEILPIPFENFEDLKELLNHQQEFLSNPSNTQEENFFSGLMQMEIDRIRYLLQSYLRVRLFKIQNNPRKVLESVAVLHSSEMEFARQYADLTESHMMRETAEALQALPKKYADIHGTPLPDENGAERYVFVRFAKDVDDVEFLNGQPAMKGDIFAAKYSDVQLHVKARDAYLL